jgi:hypothetical protein
MAPPVSIGVSLSLSSLGGVTFPGAISGFTLDNNGYLVSNADGSLWVFCIDSDGAYGLDPTTSNYLIEAA